MEKEIYDSYFSSGKIIAGWKIIRELEEDFLGKNFLAFKEFESISSIKKPATPERLIQFSSLKIIPKISQMSSIWENFFNYEGKVLQSIPPEIPIIKLFPAENLSNEINISSMKENLSQENQDFYALAMEYCPGGDLQKFVSKYPQGKMISEHVFLFLEQIVIALQYAYHHRLVHGGIAINNILLNQQQVWKISHFGLAKMAMKNPICTYPPEWFYQQNLDGASDIWSLGVLLYQLLTGVLPYSVTTPETFLMAIRRPLDWPLDLARTPRESALGLIVYLIRQMLQPDPKKRPLLWNIIEVLGRCRTWVSNQDRQNYTDMLQEQIIQNDLRPQSQFLQQLSESNENSKKILTALTNSKDDLLKKQPHKKSLVANICIFIFLLSLGWYYQEYLISTWKNISKFWTKSTSTDKTPTVTIQVLPEFPGFRWEIQFPNFSNIVLPIPTESYINATWHLKIKSEANSRNGNEAAASEKNEYSISLSWKIIQEIKYSWEVPLDLPDGKITMWLEAKQNDKIILQSIPEQIKIENSFSERQNFKKLQENIKNLEAKGADFGPILQICQEYLKQFPQTYFRDQILKTIQIYQDKASFFHYQKILSLDKQNNLNMQEIQNECEQFLQQYPKHSELEKIKNIGEYYRFWTTKKNHTIKLVRGKVVTHLLKADCYVRISVNSQLVWTSTIIISNNTPEWNTYFTISWQSGDKITVELWDKNTLGSDRCYFTQTDDSPLAIQMFNNKRISTDNAWLEFSCELPQKNW